MALAQIDFSDTEEKIIYKYSKEWELNKPKTIRKIIVEFNKNINKSERRFKK